MFWRTPVHWFKCFQQDYSNQSEPVTKSVQVKLYPHDKYPGYFIDPVNLVVYSIKSGTLRPLKLNSWKGKQMYTLSHQSIKHYHHRKWLKKCIDKHPKNTIKLDIVKG